MDSQFIMDTETRLTLLVEKYGSKGKYYAVDVGEELLDKLIHLIKNVDNNNFTAIQNECYHKLNKELER